MGAIMMGGCGSPGWRGRTAWQRGREAARAGGRAPGGVVLRSEMYLGATLRCL